LAEFVRYEVADHVAVVTLDRPPVNALNGEAYRQIVAAIDRLNGDRDVRVAILTGAGDRAFSAGNDVNEFTEVTPETADAQFARSEGAYLAIYECQVPIIAAVNGYALGSGTIFVAACDMIVAAENARFGLPEINVGVIGGGPMVRRMFPEQMLREVLFGGEMYTAEQVYRFGCIKEIVPTGQALARARELALKIAGKNPAALRIGKRQLLANEFLDVRSGVRSDYPLLKELIQYEDSKEAARAFLEKRAPRFTGR
jgi:enoyl-CoA hydratase